ncbi:MAG: hypothetical protein HOF72_03900, partial [Planctomycetaceae bacterium]|nr:hypothetical protein [Planctomycetaceae bacterium]
MPAHLQSEAAGLEPDSTQVETVTAPYGFLTDEQIYNRKTLRQVLQNVGALGISTFIHTLIFIALGILTMTPEILESLEMVVVNAPEEEIVLEEEMVTVELEEDMTPSEEINTDPTAAPAAGVPTAIGAAIFSEAQFDAEVSDSEVEPTEMAASEIKLPASVSDSLLTAIP